MPNNRTVLKATIIAFIALVTAARAFAGCGDPFTPPCPKTKPVVRLSGFDGKGRAWELTPGLQAKVKSIGKLKDIPA